MSTFNQSMPPSGHPGFSPRVRGPHEVPPQHVPVAVPSQVTHSLNSFRPSLSLSMKTQESAQGASFFPDSQVGFNRQHPRNMNPRSNSSEEPAMRIVTTNHDSEFQPLTPCIMNSFLEMGSFNLLKSNRGFPSRVVLNVVIYSAAKLENKQIDLIARKMQRLTGFRNLKLENIIDPSLIAGFVISYDTDGSRVIDLSVKGQLAALAARVESFDQGHHPL
ncbi:F-type H+-transporting ATPase subunit delta protein [Dioscorea alata]|uniref:F-type H+-transporting ATPase subunit delta protein n=1 Tax=Dioscorea alata TaxID=55571 RepID=A0ACB7U4Q4_DIOAL|nr:F-type H+-transporting ATPase subunit delta protein [Dioscorea alata]